jgi:drug/metabolite transporter (DMT)-like permease
MFSEQALYFIPVILSYALPTFIFKDVTKYFNSYELIVFYHLLYHVFILGAITFVFVYKRKQITDFVSHTITLPGNLKLLMVGIIVLGLISQYAYFQILRTMDVNSLLAIVRGASTVVVMIVGYFIYRENLTVMKILGIFLVMVGIFIINNY